MFFRANLGVSIGIFLYSVIVLAAHYTAIGATPTFLDQPKIIKKDPPIPAELEVGNPVVPMPSARRASSGG